MEYLKKGGFVGVWRVDDYLVGFILLRWLGKMWGDLEWDFFE